MRATLYAALMGAAIVLAWITIAIGIALAAPVPIDQRDNSCWQDRTPDPSLTLIGRCAQEAR